MTPEVSERSFEDAIERALLAHGPDAVAGSAGAVAEPAPPFADSAPGGYRKRRPEDYDRELYKRITDDRAFGEAIKNFLFDQYLRAHRQAEELIKRGESKTLEFKSTLRWNLKEDRQDDKAVTHAVLKTIAAFLNTEGGDLLIGVADDGSVVGVERDQLENDDKFMRHLAQVVRNGLGDRASTCIDPKMQIVQGKTVCVVTCQRGPEPVFLRWKGMEKTPDGDLYVRSGPGSVVLPPESAMEYIRTRFPGVSRSRAALPTKGAG